jgi:hypothetical protein
MATRMIQRRGTAAEWTSANPVLAAGEIGFETDTTKFKFGDGTTAWADIPYFASADQLIDGAPELLDTLNELAAAIGDDESFITTIQTDLASKLDLAGGTITGNLIVQSDATVGGNLNLSTVPVNPNSVTNKDYVDNTVGALEVTVTSVDQSLQATQTTVAGHTSNITSLQEDVAILRPVFVSAEVPTSTDKGGDAIVPGDMWYDPSNGHLYIFVYTNSEGTTSAWVESGGPDELAPAGTDAGAGAGDNNHDFPATPIAGDTHNGYIYEAVRGVWQIDRAVSLSDNTDVTLTTPADDEVLMYNASEAVFKNVPGIPLDANSDIPIEFLTTVQDALTGDGATLSNIKQVEDQIESVRTTLIGNGATAGSLKDVEDQLATEIAALLSTATTYTDLGLIETYLDGGIYTNVAQLTIKSSADWSTDVSVPLAGSLNIETGGAEIRVKVGDGVDTYATLNYIPSNADIASEIATAIAPLAPKAGPTFTGTVSLPSTTSIGDVDATEISYLNGVTSAVQTQIDDLDAAKADLASPTFTGTVSGIDKTMVGLGNVDNTTDANKPVSTATQAALDLKANLASPSFSGTAEAADLVITGNLTVQGATTTVYASDLSVRDNMIYLNQGGYYTVTAAVGDGSNVVYTTDADHNASVGEYITVTGADPATFDISGDGAEITAVTSNTITVASTVTDTFVSGGDLRVKSHANPDLGWSAGRYDVVNGTGYAHAGLFRDATDGVFKFYDGYVPEPDESVFIDTGHVSFELAPIAPGKIVFPDGTEQTKAGVASITTFSEKTADYTLDTLDHQDNIVEMNATTVPVTFTIPTDAALAWPVGASMDVFATGDQQVTIAGDTGVTVNATPGLVLRTQWSSATLLKRGPDSWVVYGDLKA